MTVGENCGFDLLGFSGESGRAAEAHRRLRHQRPAPRAPCALFTLLRRGTGVARWGSGDKLQLSRRRGMMMMRVVVVMNWRRRVMLRSLARSSSRRRMRPGCWCWAAAPRWRWMLMLRLRLWLLMLVVRMRISQAPVFSNQILHLPLEIVDSLPLGLYEALLVLHDGRQFFEIKHGFHGVVQQTLHR